MNRGGSCGKSVASASVTTSANSFSAIRSQTLKKKRPPGFSTRRASLIALHLVGKEHRAELAHHRVEALSSKGSASASACRHVIRPSPGRLRRGVIEHRLVEVGRHDAGMRGQPRRHGSCQNAGPCRRLQHVARGEPWPAARRGRAHTARKSAGPDTDRRFRGSIPRTACRSPPWRRSCRVPNRRCFILHQGGPCVANGAGMPCKSASMAKYGSQSASGGVREWSVVSGQW